MITFGRRGVLSKQLSAVCGAGLYFSCKVLKLLPKRGGVCLHFGNLANMRIAVLHKRGVTFLSHFRNKITKITDFTL